MIGLLDDCMNRYLDYGRSGRVNDRIDEISSLFTPDLQIINHHSAFINSSTLPSLWKEDVFITDLLTPAA